MNIRDPQTNSCIQPCMYIQKINVFIYFLGIVLHCTSHIFMTNPHLLSPPFRTKLICYCSIYHPFLSRGRFGINQCIASNIKHSTPCRPEGGTHGGCWEPHGYLGSTFARKCKCSWWPLSWGSRHLCGPWRYCCPECTPLQHLYKCWGKPLRLAIAIPIRCCRAHSESASSAHCLVRPRSAPLSRCPRLRTSSSPASSRPPVRASARVIWAFFAPAFGWQSRSAPAALVAWTSRCIITIPKFIRDQFHTHSGTHTNTHHFSWQTPNPWGFLSSKLRWISKTWKRPWLSASTTRWLWLNELHFSNALV